MSQQINPERSDLSVLVTVELREQLVKACKEDDISLSHATREALKRWLTARERKIKRQSDQK